MALENLKKPRGGARPGSGRKAGGKNEATISKEMAREALRRIVLREMDALVSAQVSNAKGLSYLVSRDKKTGKFIRVNEETFKAMDGDAEALDTLEVWEKDPSVQAFTDLMNRALDKPKEQEQEITLKGALDVVTVRLIEARKRLASRSSEQA